MRHLRLVLPALAFVMAGTAYQSSACEKDKAAAASASQSGTCTAQMSAQCTAEMAAACKAHGAKSATHTVSTSSCPYAKGTSATAASASGGCPYENGAAAVSADHCAGAKSAAVTASASGCPNARTTAVAAGSGDACAGHAKTMASSAGGSCTAHGAVGASGACDAHSVMALGFDDLESEGCRTQVVPLKNGVMFVYTAATPGKVNALQTALARRSERLSQVVASGDKAHLCPDCKAIRGAMASGKMTREVVNIEGGALTLMTSDDPTIVAKIHAVVENHRGMRTKT
jgi:hypothetical protein